MTKPQNSRLDFRCLRCGSPACYGEAVKLIKGESGRWYCREHVPEGFLPGSVRPPVPQSLADQGVLP